jgi:predicted lactoylglutathione lyase
MNGCKLPVTNLDTAKEFFRTSLAPLGIQLLEENRRSAGFGSDGSYDFWLRKSWWVRTPLCMTFAAHNRAQVREFHQQALANGATCRQAPSQQPALHRSMYSASVIGPNGHRVDVICLAKD